MPNAELATKIELNELAFHPTGAILAAGTHQGRVFLRNADSGELLRVLQTTSESSVCFSPDGKRLATGDGAACVRVWDWRTGQQLLAFQDNYIARGVDFSPEGSMLASGGGDPPVRVRVAWPRSAALFPEVQRRRTCHEGLLKLDAAKVAWALAGNRGAQESPTSVADLTPFLVSPAGLSVCPSGATVRLGAVTEMPACEEHGAPAMELQPLVERFDKLKSEDEPLAEILLTRLCHSPLIDVYALELLALKWIKDQHRFYRSVNRLLARATELDPSDVRRWRILGYSELHLGRVEEALARFRKGLEKDSGPSAVGLALALMTRGTELDLAEACQVLEEHPGSENAIYTKDAREALAKLPPPQDPQLPTRLQTLLEKHKTP